MHRQLRRLRWAVRKQYLKNIIACATFACTFLLLVLAFYDECSYYKALPLIHINCKEDDIAMKEKRNITIITSTSLLSVLEGEANIQTRLLYNETTTSLLPAHQTEVGEVDIEDVIIVDEVFGERKDQAEKACTDMLDSEFGKEVDLPTITFTIQHPKNETLVFTKIIKPSAVNKNMLRLMKHRNDATSKRQKHLQSTAGIKKNKWIYFHRIIKYPNNPGNSRVVELKWCPIFKAASTPWLAVFSSLAHALTNYTEAQIKHGKLGFMELAKKFRLLTPRIYDKTIHVTKYSMVVVRHPFKRLLSAYRDKIERVKGRLYYQKKYSTKIIAKFRKSELGSLERSSRDKDYLMKVPTFEEFVHYVLSTEPRKLDEHWRPIFLDCSPCRRTFDFILKVETLDQDKQKVMQYLRLSPTDPQYKEVETVWARWNNPSGRSEPNRNESYYYSQITAEEIGKLYELYEPDFLMFGYSPTVYFQMGKKPLAYNSTNNHSSSMSTIH